MNKATKMCMQMCWEQNLGKEQLKQSCRVEDMFMEQ